MSRAPRAVIADDQPILRASARRLLERDGFTVCGEASDADGAVEAAIPRGMVTCLVREFQTQGRRRTLAGEHGRADLTARETEVMELMCEGRSTGEIAERLLVSPVTVRRHISEIVGKLGVDDREEAVALVAGAAIERVQ
jgi:DNA-binding NarL/FixJ family response regulator